MGINIQIKDATFTKHINSLMPSGANLIGYWLYDDTLENSIRNKITGVSGTLIGTPTVAGGKITVDRANGFLTDIDISGEKTFVAVYTTSGGASNNTIPIGTRDYDNATTASSEYFSNYQNKFYIYVNGSARAQSPVLNVDGKVRFVAGAFGTSESNLYVSNANNLSKTTYTGASELKGLNNLRIGGWGPTNTSLIGTAIISATLVFNKKLSDSELNALYSFLKNKLTTVAIE